MSILKIDNTNEDNFKQKDFTPMPKGIYRFEVPHKLKVEKSKSSDNMLIKLSLKCVSDDNDGEYLGKTVFDNLVISQKTEWKLNAFAISSGLYTAESLKADGQIDTEDFEPGEYEVTASIDVETSTFNNKTTTKNVVKAYIFKDD